MTTIQELTELAHKNSISKGFWDQEFNMGQSLMLIVSEVSEALEADRKDQFANMKLFNKMMEGWDEGHYAYDNAFKMAFVAHIKNTVEDELSDAVIRIMDLAAYKGIDLERHIKLKMKYNSMREYKHGKKY